MSINLKVPDRYLASYRRELIEKQDNRIKVLLALLLFTIVVFVIFGIRPMLKKAREYNEIHAAFAKVDNQLKSKLEELDVSKEKMDRYSHKIDLLDRKIPSSPLLQNYLEEIVISSANTGFILQRFLVTEDAETSKTVDLAFLGDVRRLPELVGILENTYRYAVINNIKTNVEEGTNEIRINLTIYFTKK